MATASVSPIALAIPNTTAVASAGRAAGSTALYIICQRVEPSARLASLTLPGTARNASIEILAIVGTIITTSTMMAAAQPKPPAAFLSVIGAANFVKNGISTINPRKPITTEGTPTKISNSGWNTLITQRGLTSTKK